MRSMVLENCLRPLEGILRDILICGFRREYCTRLDRVMFRSHF